MAVPTTLYMGRPFMLCTRGQGRMGGGVGLFLCRGLGEKGGGVRETPGLAREGGGRGRGWGAWRLRRGPLHVSSGWVVWLPPLCIQLRAVKVLHPCTSYHTVEGLDLHPCAR